MQDHAAQPNLVARFAAATDRLEVVATLRHIVDFVKHECSTGDGLSGERYFEVAEGLLDSIDESVLGLLTASEYERCFVACFLEGPLSDAFLVLARCATREEHEGRRRVFVVEKSVQLMHVFLRSKLAELLRRTTLVKRPFAAVGELCQVVVAFPDLLARRRLENSGRSNSVVESCSVATESYFRAVTSAFIRTLEGVRATIAAGGDCNLAFLCELVAKFELAGKGALLDAIIDFLDKRARDDFVWRRISERLFVGGVGPTSRAAREQLVVRVLTRARTWKSVDRLLGDVVLREKSIEQLLCRRLLVVRYFPLQTDAPIVHRLVGYLTADDARCALVLRDGAFRELLELWANYSALLHMPKMQHLYVSTAIVLIALSVGDEQRRVASVWAAPIIVSGVAAHLRCAASETRKVGMAAGEILTKLMKTGVDEGEEELKFEYDDDDDTRFLKALKSCRHADDDDDVESSIADLVSSVENDVVSAMRSQPVALDSDDDEFEAFAIPNGEQSRVVDASSASVDEGGTVSQPVKAPLYVRDAMEGLFEERDRRRFDVCLHALPALIRQTSGFSDIALELVKVLLHCDDRFALTDFANTRLQAMCECVVAAPELVAPYLARQFYERNYSLAHRALILDTVYAAAVRLSDGSAHGDEEQQVAPSKVDPAQWRLVVSERIKVHTRRFAASDPPPRRRVIPNRLHSVVGELFFPLMAEFDRPKERCFDLLRDDSFLLARLLYVLASTLYFARNAPLLLRMVEALLDFCWPLRFHDESVVREGVLFAVSSVLLSMSARMLVLNFQEQAEELRAWLGEVKEDAAGECRKMAVQAQGLLEARMREGLGAVVAGSNAV